MAGNNFFICAEIVIFSEDNSHKACSGEHFVSIEADVIIFTKYNFNASTLVTHNSRVFLMLSETTFSIFTDKLVYLRK